VAVAAVADVAVADVAVDSVADVAVAARCLCFQILEIL
jgi:hypothetical protein